MSRLLRDRSVEKSLLPAVPCLCESFTLGHLADYDTEEKLLSADSIQTLTAAATLAGTDIAARECGHAAS